MMALHAGSRGPAGGSRPARVRESARVTARCHGTGHDPQPRQLRRGQPRASRDDAQRDARTTEVRPALSKTTATGARSSSPRRGRALNNHNETLLAADPPGTSSWPTTTNCCSPSPCFITEQPRRDRFSLPEPGDHNENRCWPLSNHHHGQPQRSACSPPSPALRGHRDGTLLAGTGGGVGPAARQNPARRHAASTWPAQQNPAGRHAGRRRREQPPTNPAARARAASSPSQHNETLLAAEQGMIVTNYNESLSAGSRGGMNLGGRQRDAPHGAGDRRAAPDERTRDPLSLLPGNLAVASRREARWGALGAGLTLPFMLVGLMRAGAWASTSRAWPSRASRPAASWQSPGGWLATAWRPTKTLLIGLGLSVAPSGAMALVHAEWHAFAAAAARGAAEPPSAGRRRTPCSPRPGQRPARATWPPPAALDHRCNAPMNVGLSRSAGQAGAPGRRLDRPLPAPLRASRRRVLARPPSLSSCSGSRGSGAAPPRRRARRRAHPEDPSG